VEVVTTDALVEGNHFRLDWTDWESLGHRALAVNLSDIAAMGAIPTVAVVSLGLRGDEAVADLEAMYGAWASSPPVTARSSSAATLFRLRGERLISVTAIGRVREGEVLLRSGARPGDAIGITGTIGAAAAGLEILLHPERFTGRTTAERLVRAHLRPEPRVEAGRLLVEHGATAAMDLSDGLAGDLPKVMTASGVSAEIELARLPVIAAVRALFPDRWPELALRGGEDFELLFTLPPDRWGAFAADAGSRDITVTRVGTVLPASGRPELWLTGPGDSRERLPAGAFDHFG